MAGKCLLSHSGRAGGEAASAPGICKINDYFTFIAKRMAEDELSGSDGNSPGTRSGFGNS